MIGPKTLALRLIVPQAPSLAISQPAVTGQQGLSNLLASPAPSPCLLIIRCNSCYVSVLPAHWLPAQNGGRAWWAGRDHVCPALRV